MVRFALISLIALFACLSCGGAKSDLDVTYSDSGTVYLIPADTQSCYMKYDGTVTVKTNDVSSKYFQLKNFKLVWNNTESVFEVALIQVTLQGSAFSQSSAMIVSSNEVYSLNSTHGTWSGVIPKAKIDSTDGKTVVPSVFNATCPLTIGGISIPQNLDVDFQATGQVQVIGVKRDDQGNEEPVTVTNYFSINNIGLNNNPSGSQ